MFSRRRVATMLAISPIIAVVVSAGKSPQAHPTAVLAASSGPPVRLGANPTRVVVLPTPEAAGTQLSEALPDRHVFLAIDGLSATGAPGVTYDVFLGPAAAQLPARDDPSYLGTLSFFDISPETPADARSVSFDATAVLVRLLHGQGISSPLAVTFLPEGPPVENSAPGFSHLKLVIP